MHIVNFADNSLFGNEAAEDETEKVFASYVAERPEVAYFLDPARRIQIAHAYKGEGKSALLKLVALKLRSRRPEPLIISGSAPGISPEVESAETDRWSRAWKTNISKLAANEIGSTINLAFGDDAISLVEEAELNGYKSRSFVGSVVDRLSSDKVPIKRVRTGVSNHEQMRARCTARRARHRR